MAAAPAPTEAHHERAMGLWSSLTAQHRGREPEVARSTLQCILRLFAEDVGRLPRRPREVLIGAACSSAPRFGAGLISNPAKLALGPEARRALGRAAELDWSGVDPQLFGRVLQEIMDAAQRHARGAHYTAREDIMCVVAPTLLEPWRRRIEGARTPAELGALREELGRFCVLDPACGSGDFLVVAYRALCRLETRLLIRVEELLERGASGGRGASWAVGIPTTNFHGIDINPLAVELARATLYIAEKLAFDERRAAASELDERTELWFTPSRSLDDLSATLTTGDAVFVEWPPVEAIVGNPPFLGGTKIREELGDAYVRRLRERFPDVHGKSDLCAFWFRRAHDRLPPGGRAGLVATQSIRVGKTREAALDYVLARGGTITDAVSSRAWPGAAKVLVSVVNWVKGPSAGPCQLEVDGQLHARRTIPAHLQLHLDLGGARPLRANKGGTIQGVQLGTKAFQVEPARARELVADREAQRFVRAEASASALLCLRPGAKPGFVIDLSSCATELEARASGPAYAHVRERVLPFVEAKARVARTGHYRKWLETWWQPRTPRTRFMASLAGLERIIVCSRHAARPIFAFLSREPLPTDSLQLFALGDDYSFGVLQSSAHWRWAVATGSKIKQDTRYLTPVWSSFAWPQSPAAAAVAAVAAAGRRLRATREVLMVSKGWSLRELHQAAAGGEAPGLLGAQRELDEAVFTAYQKPARQDILGFLLELNLRVSASEAAGEAVCGPGDPSC